MTDRENLCDFIKKILVFDPLVRYTPKEALQHKFITSTMGNTSQLLSISRNSATQPTQQRPLQPKVSKSTSSLTTAMIYASLAKARNSSSSINTSRTTEDSLEITTPIHALSPLTQKSNPPPNVNSPLDALVSLTTNKPTAAVKSNLPSTVTSPTNKPLKSILKKQPSQNYVNQQNATKVIINNSNTKQGTIPSIQQQENTLDSRVASLFQPRPASTTLSVSSNQPTIATGSFLLENGIRVGLNDLLAAQNYPQQQQYLYNNTLSPNYQPFLSPSVSAASFQSPLHAIKTQTAATTTSQHTGNINYPTNFHQPLYQTTATVPSTMATSPLIYQQQQQQSDQTRYQTTYQYLPQQQQQQTSPLLLFPGVNSYGGAL
jgi:hypothetical protein